jgi:hypothetical protein
MDQNFLGGSIPVIFGNFTILTMLNLSHNNLSGSIPIPLTKLELHIFRFVSQSSWRWSTNRRDIQKHYKNFSWRQLAALWRCTGSTYASVPQSFSEKNYMATLFCSPHIRWCCVHHITDLFHHLKKEGVKSTTIHAFFQWAIS